MRSLLFILISFSLHSQTTWEKIKQRDDILHVDGSWLMTMTGTEIIYHYTHDKKKAILGGAGISLAVGVLGKEVIHDKILGLGTFSVVDILYDCWGTLIGVIVEICWLDYRYGSYDPYSEIVIPVKKHRKRWSLKINGFLK
jgi:hypothetical protein